MLILLLAFIGAIFLFPKGNFVHEAIHMPIYWIRMMRVSTKEVHCERYHYGTHQRQYFLWLSPKKKTVSRKHIIVYYHGGGWRFGRPELFKANAKIFTDLGYTVVMPSFRPCPRHNYLDIRSDLDKTLVAIQEQMRLKGIAEKRIILGGMSAGGNLVAHILYDRFSLQQIGLLPNLFAGIFLCGAPLDLRQMRDSFVLRDFAGKRNNTLFEKANPINYLDQPQQTPILCIHGTKDGMVEYPSTLHFLEKLQTLQSQDISLHTIPNGTHLDAGSWVFDQNTIRTSIEKWVLDLENQQKIGLS